MSKKKPNDFPREGMHRPVTRAALRRLEADRPTPNAEMHYTIGGTVETLVHSTVNAEREAATTTGSRRLAQSSQQLRTGFDNARSDNRAAYVREQRALCEQSRPRARDKENTR